MGYDPVGNMINGTSRGSVDAVLAQQTAAEEQLLLREEEERKKMEAAKAATQKQTQQKKQQQEAASRNNLIGGVQEVGTALVGGFIDFGEGIGKRYNLPWMEMPDNWEPANKTEWGKALRSITEAVGPAVGAALLTRRGLNAIGARTALGDAPKWVKAIGYAGADAAAGVAVDEVSRFSTDHNLTGTLQKTWPKTWGWLPDDLATLDSDSPDVKRNKNKLEGAGLGLVVDAFQGAIDFARAVRGKSIRTEFIPKDAQAKTFSEEVAKATGENYSSHPTIDRIIRNSELRQESVDELAQLRYSKKGLNEPDPFIHEPLFDDAERLPKAVEPDGVVQAMVDARRIEKNIGTVNGRMASFMSDAAIEELDMADMAGRSLVKKIEDVIKQTGNFEVKLPDGQMMSKKDILKSGDNLSALIVNPTIKGDDLKNLFESYDLRDFKTIADGVRQGYINDSTYAAAMKSIKELKNYYLNMDTARASAYLQTSLAGEISDIAAAARVMGDEQDITRAQELILDKLKVLWYETDMAGSIAGWALNNKRVWENLSKSGDANAIKRFGEESINQLTTKAQERAAKQMQFLDYARVIGKENPNYLAPLRKAYENTDGDVDTIHKLNIYMQNTLGTFSKLFVDRSPEMPSVVVQGLFSTFYNAKLSSFLTPVKALANNFALLLMKPVSVFAGSALRGDMNTFRRGWVQYMTHMDTTMRTSAAYMGDMFKRVAEDPTITQRADFVLRNQDQLKAAELYAEAQALEGNLWPSYKVDAVKRMNAFNDHPWVRYSMNTMEAGDAYVKSAIAWAEARGQAFDQLVKEGKKVTGEDVQKISRQIYESMFDSNGMITDEAAQYASREISMNLDNELVDALNRSINRVPLLRTIVMFPRTSTNILQFVHAHSPLSIFVGDLQKVRTLVDPDQIAEFMASKGQPYTEAGWNMMKSEILGRVAIGTTLTTMGATMWLQGNLTGNGNYDRQVTKFAQNIGERPLRSWRPFPGAKWISYDGIEPISTYLALIADIFENHSTLGSANAEQMLAKLSYAFSANIVNKSFLTGLQPITDIASGNEAAFNRWTSNNLSVGLFTAMARQFMPGLREVDNDLGQMLRNKWNILDAVGAGKPLPYDYDVVDGSIVGREDPVSNLLNSVLPFKLSSGPSPEKQLLIDSEYDMQPALKKSIGNATYSNEQRSRLKQIMGESGIVKQGLNRLLKDPRIKEDLQNIAEMRDRGITSKDADLSNSYTHMQIRKIFNIATEHAKRELAREFPQINQAEAQLKRNKREMASMQYDAVLSIPK